MKRLNDLKVDMVLFVFAAAILFVGGTAKADFTFGERVNLGPLGNSPSADGDPISSASDGCTVGVANGHVTTDGRPIMWKVRDWSGRQAVVYLTAEPNYPLDYICQSNIDGGVGGGLNVAGVATGNSAVGSGANWPAIHYILANFTSIDQIRQALQSDVENGECNASGCFPFIDAEGNAVIFEIGLSDWLGEYDSTDTDREAQGLYGFVVRANEFHRKTDGTDNQSIGDRYASGTYNVLGLIDSYNLSVQTLIQGDKGPNKGYEFVRYGPGRELASISRDNNISTIVVHGVAPGEDPSMATMWIILGQSNYGIAVPTWAKVSDIPPCLASGDMYDRAASLFAKSNETATQASVFPLEAHIFHVVLNTLLPRWRVDGVAPEEMTRVEHQFAADAYSLLDCLDSRQDDNRAPEVDFEMFSEGLSFQFTLTTSDIDGSIATIVWDFGDGHTSTEHSPSHTYTVTTTYLISCTVTDNDGVSVTQYKYSVPLAESAIIVDNDALGDPGPGDPNLSDPNENGSAENPFDTIQEAIDRAHYGNIVIVMPGTYIGKGNRDLDFKRKPITVLSQAGPGTCVIDCQSLGRGFNFHNGEGRDSVLEGFSIINGKSDSGGAISFTNKSSPIIRNCIFSNNIATAIGGAVNNAEGAAALINCTFHANKDLLGGGAVGNFSNGMVITNCILMGNEPGEIYSFGTMDVTYSNISGGFGGVGNIDTDPLFADAENGDYHLKSQAGRWDVSSESWVIDEITSLCIDAGDPSSHVSDEPEPNGGRINMGAYGGTDQASMSP